LLMLDEPSNASSVFVCNLVATTYFCLIFNTSVSFSKTKNLAPRRRMHPRTRDLEDDRDLFYLAAESLLDRIKEMYTPAVSFKRKTIEHKGKLSNNMILNPFTFVPSPVKSTSILYGTWLATKRLHSHSTLMTLAKPLRATNVWHVRDLMVWIG